MSTDPCPGCGRDVPAAVAACPHCGRPTDDTAGRPPIAQALPPQPLPVEPKGEGFAGNFGCAIILVLISAVVLLVAFVLYGPTTD